MTRLDDLIREIVRDELARALADRGVGDSGGTYLSITAAAKVAGYSPRTVSRWVAEGRLPAVGSGRATRIKRADLEQTLAAGPRRRKRERELDPAAAAARDFGGRR